uniref:Acyltransferase n=1 Tax=Physcomitrium patens TaxID=3218 RepID=A0A7I4AQ54_PHYPA|nr:diacylglycerol O-acyltransferase 2-like isoform X2 [Physcomitrium patens]|eukprot:XP_024394341.1 diacylglycerol O-acyltransferase 2-like isoform X2 [Physcomitrella patens]
MAGGDLKKGFKYDVLTFLAIVVWMGGLHLNVLVVGICLANLRSHWALTLLAFWIALIFIPVRPNGGLGQAVARYICKYAPAYFPIKVVFDDENAFDSKKSYVFAAEPHSLLPIGIIALQPLSGNLPVPNLRALATSAVFWTPVVRHVWSWLGVSRVTRKFMTEFLQKGTSVIIIPGGVQECLYMERGREVVYLKKRYGFVKVALETGSLIVPTFCFGQTNCYKWWKPTGQWYSRLSRRIGFTPLVFWGRYGWLRSSNSILKPLKDCMKTTKLHWGSKIAHYLCIDRFIVPFSRIYFLSLFLKHKAFILNIYK